MVADAGNCARCAPSTRSVTALVTAVPERELEKLKRYEPEVPTNTCHSTYVGGEVVAAAPNELVPSPEPVAADGVTSVVDDI